MKLTKIFLFRFLRFEIKSCTIQLLEIKCIYINNDFEKYLIDLITYFHDSDNRKLIIFYVMFHRQSPAV